jgi:hypothetical protein
VNFLERFAAAGALVFALLTWAVIFGPAGLPSTGSRADGKSLQLGRCFVYAQGENIRARCDGSDRLLGRWPRLYFFAFDGTNFALSTIEQARRGTATLIRSGVAEETSAPGDVIYASCGTIASFDGRHGPAWDIVAGRPLRVGSLSVPACSADRAEVIGLNRSGLLVTGGGRVIRGRDRPAGGQNPYGMSMSGEYVAYSSRVGDPAQLCLDRRPFGSPACYKQRVTGPAVLSVSDDGKVLFTGFAGGECYYSGPGFSQQSKTPSPGAELHPCRDILIASPSAAPRTVVPMAGSPQWATRLQLIEIAAAVRKFSEQRRR